VILLWRGMKEEVEIEEGIGESRMIGEEEVGVEG
jgi:hypothetical protein